jgi:hypothetical protein
MASKYGGRILSAITPTTVGGSYTSSAGGMWDLVAQSQAKKALIWPKGSVPPSRPTIGTVTLVNSTATVPFTGSADLGANVLTQYNLICSDGQTFSSNTSPFTVNLTQNIVYTFAVNGSNISGMGESSVSPPIMRLGTPTPNTPVFGNSQVSVHFTRNDSNLSGLPTTYTVTSSPGNMTATGTSSPITVTGLTNGTAYTFTIKAANDYGESLVSGSSSSMIPAAVPSAPTIGAVVGGNKFATVPFTFSTNNNGDVISSYTVTSNPGGITASGTTSPITVTGLNVDLNYTFTIVANNKAGASLPSSASNSIRPALVPSQPTSVTAAYGYSTSTNVSFNAPDNGGYPITQYTVTSSPGNITATGASSPITVTGLTNNTAYTFTVKATNILGTGSASSASNSIKPGTPSAPSLSSVVYSSGTTATINFSAPSLNGGSAITGYIVTRSDGATVSGTTSPLVMSNNFVDGTLYTFTVAAINAVGTGASSNTSSQGSPKISVNITYSSAVANLTISDSTITSAAYGLGWDGVVPLLCTVTNNTTIYSTSTGSYALTIASGIPASRNFKFINNGYILGMGGNGNYAQNPGGAGGPALSVQSYITMVNNSIIGGGGGGGGGGGNWSQASWGSNGHSPGGSGGGGRSSNQSPSSGGSATSWYGGLSIGGAGSSGTFSSGGSGGGGGYAYGTERWSNGSAGGSGYDTYGSGGAGSGGAGGIANRAIAGGGGGGGGAWGSAGGTGGNASQGYGGGVTGGTGGVAVAGNVYITWSATGSRYGAIQ